jgi:hypothetical protein
MVRAIWLGLVITTRGVQNKSILGGVERELLRKGGCGDNFVNHSSQDVILKENGSIGVGVSEACTVMGSPASLGEGDSEEEAERMISAIICRPSRIVG